MPPWRVHARLLSFARVGAPAATRAVSIRWRSAWALAGTRRGGDAPNAIARIIGGQETTRAIHSKSDRLTARHRKCIWSRHFLIGQACGQQIICNVSLLRYPVTLKAQQRKFNWVSSGLLQACVLEGAC